MTLSAFKTILKSKSTIAFELPGGELVPNHFHVTEVGIINKRFIDCGGVMRHEETVNFQLWNANDYDHRLHPEKLLNIIELSESKLGITDNDIEVEYQNQTIGKYGLEYNGNNFILTSKLTDCLAKDKCGIPENQLNTVVSSVPENNACTPGSGCC